MMDFKFYKLIKPYGVENLINHELTEEARNNCLCIRQKLQE